MRPLCNYGNTNIIQEKRRDSTTTSSTQHQMECPNCNCVNIVGHDDDDDHEESSSSEDTAYCAVCCKSALRRRTMTDLIVDDKSSIKFIEVNKSSEVHLKQMENTTSQYNNNRLSSITPPSPPSSATWLLSRFSQRQRPASWYDVDFPPDRNSLFVDKKANLLLTLLGGVGRRNGLKKAKCWRRPSEIKFQHQVKKDQEIDENEQTSLNSSTDDSSSSSTHQPQYIYSNSSSSQDVLQGGLGSCWFIAALCLIADRPELLAKNLISLQYNPNGFHQIRLCQRGQWTIVTIDDFLPCDRKGQMVFSYSRRNDYWVPFLEKALAKLYGSYEAIVSGSCVEGLQTLTGEPCEIVYLEKIRNKLLSFGGGGKSSTSSFGLVDDSTTSTSNVSMESLWLKLLNARQSDHLMLALCVNKSLKLVDLQRHGLLNRHIYSILDVQEIENGYEETIKLIKLRNPWGQKEWKGEWSNNWPGWPTNIKSRLLPDNGQEESSRGSFWMSFKDVVKYFYDITICKVRSNGWYESRQSSFFGDFKSSSQAYLLNIDDESGMVGTSTTSSNSQEHEFEFELFAAGRQFNKFDRNSYPEIDLCLVLCRIVTNDQLECVGFVHEVEYFTSMSKRLPAGNYILFPCSFRAISKLAKEKSPRSSSPPNSYKYNLIVHGQCNFKLSQIELPPTQVADLFHRVALRENNIKYELNNTVRSLSVSSNIIHFLVVENLSAHRMVRVSLDLSQSKNLENTRGSCSTPIRDYLEPKSRQLIMYLTPMDYRKVFVIGYKLEYQLFNNESASMIKSRQNPSVPLFYTSLHAATNSTTTRRQTSRSFE